MFPALVAHADWSTTPRKRRLAVARRVGDGYHVSAPQPIAQPAALPARLIRQAATDADRPVVLLGLDLPLGVPAAYAARAGITDFAAWLPRLGAVDPWRNFYLPAAAPDEIGLYRPFYPARPGGARQSHLLTGLQLASPAALRRLCDHATVRRRAAAPLFWAMGAQQVGKAAISGWRDLVVPARRAAPPGAVALWPFDGRWPDLAAAAQPVCVLAEAYPAEYVAQLGVDFGRISKRNPAARAVVGAQLAAWADAHAVTLSDELRAALRAGFGPGAAGEDPLDAVIGVCGLLNVVLHALPDMPDGLPPSVRHVEGWIFGQQDWPA